MRLRLLARFRRPVRPRHDRRTALGELDPPPAEVAVAPPSPPAGGKHRKDDRAPPDAGFPWVAESEPSPDGAPFASPVRDARTRPPRTGRPDSVTAVGGRRTGAARAAVRASTKTAAEARAANAAARQRHARPASQVRLPWYEIAHAQKMAAGRRDCGPLEKVLRRDWAEGTLPPPEVIRAIDRLAELPLTVSRRLASGLDAIYVGPGGVPDLDDMTRLKGVPLPSGRATWDACAGAYGERKIIVGTRPSSTPDVVCHEVGHALDDLDGSGGMWQSDSDNFRLLYDRCVPRLVSEFHRQPGSLGRREFFADAFAAIASSQRPALVDMLGGDTRTALDVMLYFNLRYGI
jgi:hypothetical protein